MADRIIKGTANQALYAIISRPLTGYLWDGGSIAYTAETAATLLTGDGEYLLTNTTTDWSAFPVGYYGYFGTSNPWMFKVLEVSYGANDKVLRVAPVIASLSLAASGQNVRREGAWRASGAATTWATLAANSQLSEIIVNTAATPTGLYRLTYPVHPNFAGVVSLQNAAALYPFGALSPVLKAEHLAVFVYTAATIGAAVPADTLVTSWLEPVGRVS